MTAAIDPKLEASWKEALGAEFQQPYFAALKAFLQAEKAAGRVVYPGLAVYSASKFFVEALSKGLRLETAGTGVKVSTVQPGNVATDLLSLSGDEEALEQYGQPTGARVLDPEDVARLARPILLNGLATRLTGDFDPSMQPVAGEVELW